MKCPGQDSRYWKPGAIFEAPCPTCGALLEFFKDDTWRLCKACGRKAPNPHMDFGCATYCPYAEQCLGGLPPELAGKKKDLLKNRIAAKVEQRLAKDSETAGKVDELVHLAQELGRMEQADTSVLVAAAYLCLLKDMGGEILSAAGASEEMIDKVDLVLGELKSAEPPASLEARCLHDALILAGVEDRSRPMTTAAGRQLAGAASEDHPPAPA